MFPERVSYHSTFLSLLQEQIERMVRLFGVGCFATGMSPGPEMFAAEMVLQFKNKYPLQLECVLPFEEQAIHWPEKIRERYFGILARADRETMLQTHSTPDCLQVCNRYLIEKSKYLLVFWPGDEDRPLPALLANPPKGKHLFLLDPITGTVKPDLSMISGAME